jgi:broad specificity phosphatase PhoE
MRLILVRHGETEHNRGNVTLGRADVPLNETGRRHAKALAASFVRPPDAICSSPLVRAHDTALAIGEATGVKVDVEDALIEMDVGEMEHLTGAELRQKYPEFLGLWLAGESVADARMPGGETLREVQERAWGAIERIRAAHADGEVVAVTHNFVILTTVCRAIGLPLAGFRRIRDNVGAKTVIEISDAGCQLVALNDRAHLTA